MCCFSNTRRLYFITLSRIIFGTVFALSQNEQRMSTSLFIHNKRQQYLQIENGEILKVFLHFKYLKIQRIILFWKTIRFPRIK